MIHVTPFEELGRFDYDWLKARYHFSFGDYHDPERVWFGPLRVWNDDTVRANSGFPLHGHRDMEIITYVREGAVSHEDDRGNRGRTAAGQVQVMSAGTGISHAEFNAESEDLRLFQIWVRPDRTGHAPRWETRTFERADRQGRLVALVTGNPGVHPQALTIHQDATLFAAELAAGESVSHTLAAERRAYLVPSRGVITVNGIEAGERAGIRVEDEREIVIAANSPAEILLLDLP